MHHSCHLYLCVLLFLDQIPGFDLDESNGYSKKQINKKNRLKEVNEEPVRELKGENK